MDSTRIQLVVNADDFGASDAATRGVLRAHREGVVTSTSVVGNCEGAEEVARQLTAAPALGVGVHLVLIGGRPVSDPASIPSLVGADGRFVASSGELYLRWGKAQLVDAEVTRELDAQVARLRDLGIPLDHLDAHRHAGFLPVVAREMETPPPRNRTRRSSAEK